MEKFDAKKTANVWDRVVASGQPEGLPVEGMLLQLWENAVAFLHLSKRLQVYR